MVSCSGDNVAVWWATGDISPSGAYRLCVTDRCEDVRAQSYGEYLTVFTAGATQGDEIRFQVIDRSGVVDEYIGTADITGGCCPGTELRLALGETLESERMRATALDR